MLAVLDSGIPILNGSLSHDDLNDSNRFLLGGDHIGDGNGVKDENSHGSHVLGIAAAESNNGEGVAGVAWDTKAYVAQVFDDEGSGFDIDFYQGVVDAVNAGADVINFSGSGENPSYYFEQGVQYAENADVLIVASAGNDASDVKYPAAYSASYNNVVAVSATDEQDQLRFDSNFGPEITVAAPGDAILSTGTNYSSTKNPAGTSYILKGGTSMAAPHVAGVAALMLSANSSLTAGKVRDIIERSADDIGALGFDEDFGYGLLNAHQSVYNSQPLAGVTISGPTCAVSGEPARFTTFRDKGVVPVHYTWEKYLICELDPAKASNGGDVGTLAEPCGEWVAAGSGYEEWVNLSETQDYRIRVHASDAQTYGATSNTIWVNVEERTGPDNPCHSTFNASSMQGDTARATEGMSLAVPESFRLLQNYPNPFNPATEIRFDLPEAMHVSLIVYDAVGRQVALLVDGQLEAGYRSVRFDAANLPSGVYVYRLNAGSFSESRHMVLLK